MTQKGASWVIRPYKSNVLIVPNTSQGLSQILCLQSEPYALLYTYTCLR